MSRAALQTPMMRQYLAIKAEHPDAIVFYRMGDFYEMFLEDAERAAPLLDIALTTRDKGKPDAVPMCGVPVHSATQYVRRLAELGMRVAICEQVEDARAASARPGAAKLVRREVVEVVTPGLLGDLEGLDAATEVAVAALAPGDPGGVAGLAALEASTGSFRATQAARDAELPAALLDELERVNPREVLLPLPADESLVAALRARLPRAALTWVDAKSYDSAAVAAPPEGFAAGEHAADLRAAAALLAYVGDHQPFALRHAARLRRYRLGDAMILDAATRAHLELFENAEDGSRRATLIGRLDETRTPLGARCLARWIAYPLLDPGAIRARQDAVAWLAERDRVRARLRDALGAVRDLERLLARSARPGATPRELAALRASLAALPGVGAALDADESALLGDAGRPAALPRPQPVPDALRLLDEALVEDPPALPRGSRGANETGFIREGFRPELDALRDAGRKGREWVAGLEARERERTGIASLRARFHPVHGYGLEVTRANLGRVPADWQRKQTLANAERFTTPELREREAQILGATERAAALEREIFESVRQEVLARTPAIRAAAEAVAGLDALSALAEVARRDGWVRPEVDDGEQLEIRAGRHPVIEPLLAGRGGEGFVPNDARLDPTATQILLVTGPNMSGKSTYLRQVALIVLLAQIGSFVPAEAARVGVVDRVFTRIGASDRLARGESTFMVEMRETAEILAQASRRSLVILDEIGRGTSTFDGLSIAWAVAEYLHDTPGLGARTLFATHYHELADLARTRPRVRNAHFEVREWGDEVIFLRRLLAGEASRSYGIQVARLAGLPAAVIARARVILHNLESGELDPEGRPRLAEGGAAAPPRDAQLALFAAGAAERAAAEAAVAAELRALDPDRVAPLDALLLLRRLREKLAGGAALLLALLVGLAAAEPAAAAGAVKRVRHWSYPGYTRVVVELTQPVRTAVRRLPPADGRRERLYFDLADIRVNPRREEQIGVGDGLLHAVRIGQNRPDRARVVIDLDRYDRHRLLVLRAPDRVVIDVYGDAAGAEPERGRLTADLRPVRTVVLDPGHGGRDPGAIGASGLREKDVTRRLAEALRTRLEAAGFRVVLTREGDETRSLEERTAIAEGAEGDIFVSLHANAAPRRGAQGIETYYLDESHERHTLRLAALENDIPARDLDELQRTLASLRVSEASEHSAELAQHVHAALLDGLQRRYDGVHDLGVKRGPFYVLFLSAMPAILIESGFLTHRDEARRLGSAEYLELIADRIAMGLRDYRDHRGRRVPLLAGGGS